MTITEVQNRSAQIAARAERSSFDLTCARTWGARAVEQLDNLAGHVEFEWAWGIEVCTAEAVRCARIAARHAIYAMGGDL